MDNVTFTDIDESGTDEFLKGIAKELEKFTYKPQAVLRVNIPKANGKTRPLGIPTIKDRVIQMAVKLIMEPIFEADFKESSYGFRPSRSAHDAIREIKKKLLNGKAEIFDADLSAYFDTIPHNELMCLISKRISDKYILQLIKMWLKLLNGKAEIPMYMRYKRYTGGKKNKVGTPQGGVISPLLANIYLHLLDKAVNKASGIFWICGVEIVRYADDFVLMGKKIPEEVIAYLKHMLTRMKLKINEEKSRMLNAYKKSFDFLGFTFRYSADIHLKERYYWYIAPSGKSQKKLRSTIRKYLKYNGHRAPEVITKELNAKTRGWLNYFSVEKVSYPTMAKKKLRYYLSMKLNRVYKRKSQRKCKRYSKCAMDYLIKHFGLIDPSNYAPYSSTVKA